MTRRFLLAVAAAAVTVAVAGPAVAATPTTPSVPTTWPGANLMPIKGMAYQPAPSNYAPCGGCVYYDTDFYNADFSALWASGAGNRGDLATMAADGVNLLHLYDWNPARDHLSFLNAAQTAGITVAVPISNYFVSGDPNAATDIASIVGQIYVDSTGAKSTTPHPAVSMITIANEYDLNGISPAQVAQAAASVVAAETALGATTLLPVAVPVSFAVGSGTVPGVAATQAVMTAFTAQAGLGSAFVTSRFIAATNPQNSGTYLSSGLPGGQSYYAAFAAAIPNTPLWFSEFGAGEVDACIDTGLSSSTACPNGPATQSTWNQGMWAAAPAGAGGILLGSAQFEFVDEWWKTPSYTSANAESNPTTPLNAVTGPAWSWTNGPFSGTPVNDGVFGVYTITPGSTPTTATTTGGQTYLVDALTPKLALTPMQDAFSSTQLVTASAVAGPRATGAFRPDPRDVYALDRRTHRWSVELDGSRAGIARGNAIDAFTAAPDGTLVLSLRRGQTLPGGVTVSARDLVRYDPARQRFTVALRDAGADVDAIAVPKRGAIAVSRTGSSDLVTRSGGRWTTFVDGHALGLDGRDEDVDGAWIDPADGALVLSTRGRFRVPGLQGAGADAFVVRPQATGGRATPVFVGALNGLDGVNVTGYALRR